LILKGTKFRPKPSNSVIISVKINLIAEFLRMLRGGRGGAGNFITQKEADEVAKLRVEVRPPIDRVFRQPHR
jgi:hypothetical protein